MKRVRLIRLLDILSLLLSFAVEFVSSAGAETAFNNGDFTYKVNEDNDTVTSLGKAVFTDCDISTLATLSVNITGDVDSTFEGCASLENVHIPAGVTSLKNTYNVCSSLNLKVDSSVEKIYGICERD